MNGLAVSFVYGFALQEDGFREAGPRRVSWQSVHC